MSRFALILLVLAAFLSCEKKSNSYENVYVFDEPAVFHAAVPDSSGGVFVLLSGISDLGYPEAFWLMFVDESGERIYDLSLGKLSDCSLEASPLGGCFLAGVDRSLGQARAFFLKGNGSLEWKKTIELDEHESFVNLHPAAEGGLFLSTEAAILDDSAGFRSWQRLLAWDANGKEMEGFSTDTLTNFESRGLFSREGGGFLRLGSRSRMLEGQKLVEQNVLIQLDEKGQQEKAWEEEGERMAMFPAQGDLHPSGSFLLSVLEVSDTVQKDKLLLQVFDSKLMEKQKEVRLPSEVFGPVALSPAADGGYYLLGGRGFSLDEASLDWLKLHKLDKDLRVSWISQYGNQTCMGPYALGQFANGDLMLGAQYGDLRNAVILVRCDAGGQNLPEQKRRNLRKQSTSLEN